MDIADLFRANLYGSAQGGPIGSSVNAGIVAQSPFGIQTGVDGSFSQGKGYMQGQVAPHLKLNLGPTYLAGKLIADAVRAGGQTYKNVGSNVAAGMNLPIGQGGNFSAGIDKYNGVAPSYNAGFNQDFNGGNFNIGVTRHPDRNTSANIRYTTKF